MSLLRSLYIRTGDANANPPRRSENTSKRRVTFNKNCVSEKQRDRQTEWFLLRIHRFHLLCSLSPSKRTHAWMGKYVNIMTLGTIPSLILHVHFICILWCCFLFFKDVLVGFYVVSHKRKTSNTHLRKSTLLFTKVIPETKVLANKNIVISSKSTGGGGGEFGQRDNWAVALRIRAEVWTKASSPHVYNM